MKRSINPSMLFPLALIVSIAACSKPAAPPDAATAVPPKTAESPVAAMPSEPAAAVSAEVTVPMTLIDAKGTGADAGTIKVSEGASGLVFQADLKGLPPGPHGFHVHQNGSCGPGDKDGKPAAGIAAGEHYDPTMQGKHAGPDGMGHAGDLPRVTVGSEGTVSTSFSDARLKLADLRGRSLMIHAEADDYAMAPGGARIACGVVP